MNGSKNKYYIVMYIIEQVFPVGWAYKINLTAECARAIETSNLILIKKCIDEGRPDLRYLITNVLD